MEPKENIVSVCSYAMWSIVVVSLVLSLGVVVVKIAYVNARIYWVGEGSRTCVGHSTARGFVNVIHGYFIYFYDNPWR